MNTKLYGLTTPAEQLKPLGEWIGEATRIVNGLLPSTGKGLKVHRGTHGSYYEVDGATNVPGSLLAIIVDKGPNDESDFTDNRYWVRLAYLDQSSGEDVTKKAEPKVLDSIDNLAFVATSLTESVSGSHYLRHGDFIWIKPVRGYSTNGVVFDQWVFVQNTAPIIVRLDTAPSSSVSSAEWRYAGTDANGNRYTNIRNGFEPANGSPGPSGDSVSSGGAVNGSSCHVRPIGPAEVEIYPDPWGVADWWFSKPNSSQ